MINITINNLPKGDKKTAAIIEYLSNCQVDFSTEPQSQKPQQTTTDEAGHHSEWKFCPGCGFDWDIKMGADQFGCWNCGFIRKQGQ